LDEESIDDGTDDARGRGGLGGDVLLMNMTFVVEMDDDAAICCVAA